MKQRILSLISVIVLACFTLSGCGNLSDVSSTTNTSSQNASQSEVLSTQTTQTTETIATTLTSASTKNQTTAQANTKAKSNTKSKTSSTQKAATNTKFSSDKIPDYSGKAYVSVNGGKPYFSKSDYTTSSYEHYSELDNLGRCGVAVACVGTDIMPTEERGSIGQVKPTGWHTVKYDCVDGKYLYNRCHLIGYQLTGENANPKNLITGTRYLNVDGMLPFENMVADYVKETHNHVMYRVTPVFSGKNLLADGVLMEAYSVEDNGDGICFNVFCYNVQPGVKISYSDGSSSSSGQSNDQKTGSTKKKATTKKSSDNSSDNKSATYILNTSSKKFHNPSCSSAKKIKDKNKETFKGKRSELIDQGYSPCKICNP